MHRPRRKIGGSAPNGSYGRTLRPTVGSTGKSVMPRPASTATRTSGRLLPEKAIYQRRRSRRCARTFRRGRARRAERRPEVSGPANRRGRPALRTSSSAPESLRGNRRWARNSLTTAMSNSPPRYRRVSWRLSPAVTSSLISRCSRAKSRNSTAIGPLTASYGRPRRIEVVPAGSPRTVRASCCSARMRRA